MAGPPSIPAALSASGQYHSRWAGKSSSCRSACYRSRVSSSWCGCRRPSVALHHIIDNTTPQVRDVRLQRLAAPVDLRSGRRRGDSSATRAGTCADCDCARGPGAWAHGLRCAAHRGCTDLRSTNIYQSLARNKPKPGRVAPNVCIKHMQYCPVGKAYLRLQMTDKQAHNMATREDS